MLPATRRVSIPASTFGPSKLLDSYDCHGVSVAAEAPRASNDKTVSGRRARTGRLVDQSAKPALPGSGGTFPEAAVCLSRVQHGQGTTVVSIRTLSHRKIVPGLPTEENYGRRRMPASSTVTVSRNCLLFPGDHVYADLAGHPFCLVQRRR